MAKDSFASISKALGKLGARVLNDASKLEFSYVLDTGIFPLNLILSKKGGLPNSTVELFGDPGTGKSSVTFSIIRMLKEVDSVDKKFFFDVERGVRESILSMFDISPITEENPDGDFYLAKPSTAEETLESIEYVLKTYPRSLIVLDSVASCIPKGQYEAKYGDASYAKLPAYLSVFMEKARTLCEEMDSTLILINQQRANISSYKNAPAKKQPGGFAVPYFCDVRLEIRVIEKIKRGEEIVGQKLQATTVKNKHFSPWQKANFHLIYGQGFHSGFDLLEANFSMGLGVIKKAGAWFEFPDESKEQGQVAAANRIRNDPEVQAAIKSAYEELLS